LYGGWLNARSHFYIGNDSFLSNCHRLRALVRETAIEEWRMNVESMVGLVVSGLLLIYLIYALLRPEKF
jgi:K+-transporting ATPase KdpF subunit